MVAEIPACPGVSGVVALAQSAPSAFDVPGLLPEYAVDVWRLAIACPFSREPDVLLALFVPALLAQFPQSVSPEVLASCNLASSLIEQMMRILRIFATQYE